MKSYYRIGGDIFVAVAFVAFIVGGMLYLAGINELFWNISAQGLMKLSAMSLLFSIALSLLDISQKTS